jgi:hypothetical protein
VKFPEKTEQEKNKVSENLGDLPELTLANYK